ncbi:zinc finger protein 271 isoform X5 [Procambarus clarkii]|uniref:zinc finger protein 271 isoform X5 n=1 Tax=Procambarus clarkii TaxID=6728 RepID=UPI001E6748F3|nr:zinc finger protein 271-like isoform X5 [Procambarus clarkii]
MASDKKIIDEVGESSHDTPQAITITIMDPSALEATDLDSSLVTSVETQDDRHGTSTLLVVPGDGHASISVEHGAKNILQTVTETHMGTHELPVISNISNPEEETSEQNSIHVTKTSQIIDEGEGVDEEDGEEPDESVGQHCLICNVDLPSEESTEPVLVFKTQTTTTQRKMSVFLGSLIGQKLTSRKAHSDIMCHRCFGLLDRVDSLEVEIRDTKEEIVNKYQETVAVYGGRARRRKPATAKKTDYVFPKVEPEDEDEQVLGLEMDENFEPRVEDLMEEENDHREDRSTQDEEWEPEFKKPRIKREAVDAESSGPTKRKRGRPRKDAAKPKESADVVTIGLAANTPAREWSQGASGNAITVFCPTDGSRLRRRRPASYRPCDLCGVIPFGDVERHVAEYHPETLIRPCALCDARFRTFRQLGSHVLRIHGPCLLCPTCSSAFSDVSAFEKHLRHSHSEIPAAFTCVVCRLTLSSSVDYCTHMETHQAEAALLSAEDQSGKTEVTDSVQNSVDIFEDEQSQLWCNLCQKKLKSSVALKRHLQRVHGERPSFQCEICFLRFQSSGGLLDHTETHTTGAVQCPLCEKQFAKFHHLRSHCDAVHVDTASFRCQHCSYVAKSINALFTHVLVRHPDQLGLARNVRCTKCGEKFHSGRELSQHKAARHAELVECIHCGKQLSKYLIASHINEKHTREHKSECSFCGQAFFNQGKLSEHVKRHHLREHYARFICHICNKAYITRHELLRHTAAHQNERRYKCEFCSRAYFKAGDLTYHRRTHTGERPHGCTSCEAAFSRPSELTTHLARAHGLHHRTRRYFRTATSDVLESTTGPSEVVPNRSIDQTVDVQVVAEDVGDTSQLITEVGEAGHVVHVVEGDMQVIYVELME